MHPTNSGFFLLWVRNVHGSDDHAEHLGLETMLSIDYNLTLSTENPKEEVGYLSWANGFRSPDLRR